MVAERSKKAKTLQPEEAEVLEHIDGELVLSIEKLQEVQDELERINDEESDKVLEVEEKYNVVRKPIYDKRNEVIRAIPEFWLTAFLSHPALSCLLTEDDHKIFKYLLCLNVEDFKKEKSGYSITFDFQANPYFENDKLTKTFYYDDGGNAGITATKISWKKGMNIFNGPIQEGKGKKRSAKQESFFTWLSEDRVGCGAEVLDDEVADIIKDDLWINPLSYFNNEGDANEADEEDDDRNSNDDSDDDEEDEEDEEDDNEDES
ncbi:NAP1-related protein 2-like [Aristolochia californica]|uniref:NAP1-related protein 2-like n=1 Tax=Aristolochia californica TaxID=171875 RepID=UPI0035D9BE3D